jgi:hypothetical protein
LYGDYLIIIGNPLAPPTPAARTAPHRTRQQFGKNLAQAAVRTLTGLSPT